MKLPLFTSSAGIEHSMIEDENGTSFAATAPTDPIIDRNIAMRNHNDGYSESREICRVATVPYIIGLKWWNEEGWWFLDPDHSDKLVQKLNDPDWAYLRTGGGRLALDNGVMR